MALDRTALEGLARDQLIREARRFGVQRPEVMTRVELMDEVLRLGTPNPAERKRVRGWLGVARDLIADAVERGLNLPDAAALIRGDVKFEPLEPVHPPVATVTLAEIYGAQGHFQKALVMLDEVLEKEPDHEAARKLRHRIDRDRASGRRSAAGAVASVPTVTPEEPEAMAATDVVAQEPEATIAPSAAVDEPAEVVPSSVTTESEVAAPAGATDEQEPLTPRRLSKQPPPIAVGITDDDTEPLTPRRLSKQPPAMVESAVDDDAEPLTSRRLSKRPPPDIAAVKDDVEPPTPRRASQQSAPSAAVTNVFDDGAVLVRTAPSRAVVYFELGGELTNGNAAIVQVAEWRPCPTGAVRVEHEVVVTGAQGTVLVDGVAPNATLRAAVGERCHGRFRPRTVAVEVALLPAGPDVIWSPRPHKDYGETVRRAVAAIASA